MRKRQLTLIISAAVVATVALVLGLALGLGWFEEADESAQDDTAATTTTVAPDPTEITIYDRTVNAQGGAVTKPIESITVSNTRDAFKVITRTDKTMAVEAYSDLLTDTTALDALCANAAKLTAVKALDPTDDTAQFGFDAPLATVTVRFYDGSEQSFEIGNESQGTAGYYLRLTGEETIYIADTYTVGGFLEEGKFFVGKSLITPPAPKADDKEGVPQLLQLWLTGTCRDVPVEIAVDTAGEHLGLTYVSTFVMKAPYLRAVDSDSFHTMASTMKSLTAVGVEMPHPTVEQLETYGLSDPYSVAAFTLSVVATSADDSGATVSTHYNDREHMIILGNKDENGNYYALVDGLDTVYLLSPTSVPWAELSHFDLMSKLLFMKAITTVDSITVTDNGTATAFALEHRPDAATRDEQMIVTAGGKAYDTGDFRTLYQMMIGIKRVAEKEDGAVAAGTPVLRFDLTFNDGTAPMSVSMYPMTANRYLCVTDDGEETAVSISDVETFLKQYENYLKGEPVLSPY